MEKNKYQVCKNCVMDTSDSKISFDENGVCDHCNNFYNNIKPNWIPDERGERKLEEIVKQIKKDGENKSYDCIIGLSGGIDSSYLVYYAVEKLKLRPLIFCVDTGWALNVAVENIEKIVKGLDLDLYTEVINWNELRDLQLSFFKSQVPYQDLPQDHVIFASLYNHAIKNGIKYVLTGGNFSTECVREPNEWVYQNDLRMIKDIHKKFGKTPLKTLPKCSIFKNHIYYRYLKGLKIVKPLDLIPYKKETAIVTLEEKFGWQRYENKHYENIFTRFMEGYWLVEKFGYDKRKAYFSSLILTGQMTREEALEKLNQSPYDRKQALQDMEYVSKKIGISKIEFLEMMSKENKSYKDYRSNDKLINIAVKMGQMFLGEKRNYR